MAMILKVLRGPLVVVVTAVLTATVVTGQGVPTSSDTRTTDQPAAEEQEFPLPVSLERIRIGLERGPGLRISLGRQPDFHVKIVRIEPFDLERALARSASESATKVFRPSAGIDLLSLIRGEISRAARARAEQDARDTVRRDIQEFCMAHPDQRAALPACAEVKVAR